MKATLMSSLILPGIPTPRCTTCFSSNFTCSWTFMCFANNFISLLSPLNGVIDLMSSRARMAEPQIISIRTDFFSLWFFRSFTHFGQTEKRPLEKHYPTYSKIRPPKLNILQLLHYYLI